MRGACVRVCMCVCCGRVCRCVCVLWACVHGWWVMAMFQALCTTISINHTPTQPPSPGQPAHWPAHCAALSTPGSRTGRRGSGYPTESDARGRSDQTGARPVRPSWPASPHQNFMKAQAPSGFLAARGTTNKLPLTQPALSIPPGGAGNGVTPYCVTGRPSRRDASLAATISRTRHCPSISTAYRPCSSGEPAPGSD